MSRTYRTLPHWTTDAAMTRDGITRSASLKGTTEHLGDWFGEDLYAPGAAKAVRRQQHRKSRQAIRQQLRTPQEW